MLKNYSDEELARDLEISSEAEGVGYRFALPEVSRREFVAVLGAGVMIAVGGAAVGGGSTRRTIPAIRQGGAAGGEGLGGLGGTQWGVGAAEVEVREGKVVHAASKREVTFGALAGAQDVEKLLAAVPGNRNV